DCLFPVNPTRVDALPLEKTTGLMRSVLYPPLLSLLGRKFLLRLRPRSGCLAVPRRLETAAISSGFPLPASRLAPPVISFAHRPCALRFLRTARRRSCRESCRR